MYFDALNYGGDNPPPIYRADEARIEETERRANATCKLLTEETGEAHFVDKWVTGFVVFKNG